MNNFGITLGLIGLACWSGCGGSQEPIPASPAAGAATAEPGAENRSLKIVQETPAEPRTRRFTFHYRFQVKNLTPGSDADQPIVRVWLPAATTSDEQQVRRLEAIAPGEVSEHREAQFGNRILYFQTAIPADGALAVDVPYQVTRREVLRGPATNVEAPNAPLAAGEREAFLRADTLVPTSGKPLKMLDDVQLRIDKLDLARQLYDLVDDHVVYKKEGTGWGRGDTNWVCDSGYGNCTDFHSLFISLARSQDLPARFEIGFSIPTDEPAGSVTGYHCWAWFHTAGRGWTPVDISEADKHPALKDYYFGNLTPDRVTFSVGRDLKLVPAAASPPLNFFIYPHIEVNGQVLPKEQVELQYAFEDETL